MEIRETFSVLGIEPTKDTAGIKSAYRERLQRTNPEEDPEGFKRLRAAYEKACAYAARTETAQEDKARDDSPSGLWLEQVKEIYESLRSRMDIEQWEAVLNDDIFISLEEEENCRKKLLRFLMDHFRLPTDVWKLLDKKLYLVKDAKKLRESFRVDFVNYVVTKCEQGEDIDFALFEGAPDALYDLFLNYYDECWRALRDGSLDKAAAALEAADGLHIYHPAMEILRAGILLKREKKEEALALAEDLLKKYPRDDMVRYNVAEITWKLERRETAAAIFEGLKAENDKHYMANLRLTEWYYSRGDYRTAKKCAEKVLRAGADESFMELLVKINSELENDYIERWEWWRDWDAGMDLGWCWLQDGKICRGIQLAVELGKQEKQQPPEKQAAYNGLLTKLYLEEAEYEDALFMAGVWEKSLKEKMAAEEEGEEKERDRDRMFQARMIRIQCCRNLGLKDPIYFDKALEEFGDLEAGTPKELSLLMEKAHIYLEKGEYELCRKITDKLIAEYQLHAANIIAMESWHRQWDAVGVLRCAKQCIEAYPGYVRAYEHVARVYLDLGYSDELKAFLEEARKNKVESVILDAYRYQMAHQRPKDGSLESKLKTFRKNFTRRLEAGEMPFYEKGLPILTEYLYWYPNSYMLRERALFHRSGRHYEEALADFEKSLADEPASFYALRGMALTYLYMGDLESALIYMKRAILYLGGEEWPGVYAELALIYSRLRYHEMALNAYRQYELVLGGGRADDVTIRSMARTLALCGRQQEAWEKLRGYYDGAKGLPERYEHLVDLCQSTGQKDKAEVLLAQWRENLRSCKNYAEYCCYMGWQELLYGDGEKAVRWLSKVRDGRKRDRRLKREKPCDDDEKEGLCDLIFACILTGNTKRGRKSAEKLRAWRRKDKYKAVSSYFGAEKARLFMDFLADYYYAGDSELQALLDAEADTEACRSCIYCLCKEMEAARLLLMLRQGRRDEAEKRLKRNFKVQPMDEYSMAIKHVLEQNRAMI